VRGTYGAARTGLIWIKAWLRGLVSRRRRRAVITFRAGDIFESRAQTITNTVNCVGVMGKGLALEFKRRYPAMYEDYVARCKAREVVPGEPYLYRGGSPWILNFPTKRHWRAGSRLEDIDAGLAFLRDHASDWGITSLALPPLGCGEGGLNWDDVRPMMERHVGALGIPVEVYAPARRGPT
jgi:O-acetyl-ADP-ribose deacetylase (regulator of RNase III)